VLQLANPRYAQGCADGGDCKSLERILLLRSNPELGCYDGILALSAQELAQYGLGIAKSVTPCRIKEGNPSLPGGVHRAQRGSAAYAPQHRSAAKSQHGCSYFAACAPEHMPYLIAKIDSNSLARLLGRAEGPFRPAEARQMGVYLSHEPAAEAADILPLSR